MMKYHVEVYPKAKGNLSWGHVEGPHYTAEDERETCEEIRLSILKHVDNIEGIWVVEEKEN